jgi:hypothetical protein
MGYQNAGGYRFALPHHGSVRFLIPEAVFDFIFKSTVNYLFCRQNKPGLFQGYAWCLLDFTFIRLCNASNKKMKSMRCRWFAVFRSISKVEKAWRFKGTIETLMATVIGAGFFQLRKRDLLM